MFIMGYIAITQLKLPHIKYALFVIIYGSAIISALIIRYMERFLKIEATSAITNIITVTEQKKALPSRFSFELLDSSIMNGFEIVTKIGGYIILFSILAQIINEVGPDISFYKAFLMGIFEITTGISQICKAGIDINTKIVLVAVLTSFGGFSGMAQTKSVLGDSRLSMKSYFIVKLLNAAISLLFAFLYVALFRMA
jgi:hypothetical protein